MSFFMLWKISCCLTIKDRIVRSRDVNKKLTKPEIIFTSASLFITKCSTYLDQMFNDCLKILFFFPVSQTYCTSWKMKNNDVILIPNSLNSIWILLYFESFILFALHIPMSYWIKIFHTFKLNLPQWEDSSAYRTTELQVCYQLVNTCLHFSLFFLGERILWNIERWRCEP